MTRWPLATRDWPELPYDAWAGTRETLHMCLQIIGKVRLALTRREPQWANVLLYVTGRGLTTSPMWGGRSAFSLDVDFIDHQVIIATSQGLRDRVALTARPVADFYRELMDSLRGAGIDVRISPVPSEVASPVPFPDDTIHADYDPDWANRFWRLLSAIDLVLKEHRARFNGRTTAVGLFWGTLDLVYMRFCGRPATPPPNAGVIARFSADAELIAGGFWSGNSKLPEPAFFAYSYPKPEGLEYARLPAKGGGWNSDLGEFILTYADARRTGDPARALLDFLDGTYDACASRLAWGAELVSGSGEPVSSTVNPQTANKSGH